MSQYEPLYDSFSHGGHGGYVPTPRMSVSASVYLPGSDVDPQTGWLKPDRQRRCRTQGKKAGDGAPHPRAAGPGRIHPAGNEQGRRADLRAHGRFSHGAAAVYMRPVRAASAGHHCRPAKRTSTVWNAPSRIAAARTRPGKAQIAEASTEAAICYAAARDLNMIPAESAEAIHLVAVDTRPMASAGTETQAQADAAIEVPSAQTTSATHVPAVASN